MKVSSKARSAVMAMVQLVHEKDRYLPLSSLSEADGISVTFLEQIFLKLKKSSLVTSQRGIQGGYGLARDPKTITILDIIHAVDAPQKAVRCVAHQGCTPQGARCSTHHLWEALDILKESFLTSTTLFDVAHNQVKLK